MAPPTRCVGKNILWLVVQALIDCKGRGLTPPLRRPQFHPVRYIRGSTGLCSTRRSPRRPKRDGSAAKNCSINLQVRWAGFRRRFVVPNHYRREQCRHWRTKQYMLTWSCIVTLSISLLWCPRPPNEDPPRTQLKMHDFYDSRTFWPRCRQNQIR